MSVWMLTQGSSAVFLGTQDEWELVLLSGCGIWAGEVAKEDFILGVV